MAEAALKICGLTRRSDARAAVEAGARFLGCVLVPGSPRRVSPERAREVTEGLGAVPVVVVADTAPGAVADLARRAGAGVVQLHGSETPEEVGAVGRRGSWRVWKAVRVRAPSDALRAYERYGPVADGLLLDGWHPQLLGGAGRRFPWEAVAAVRDRFPPEPTLVIAGGITPENAPEALTSLEPDVIDVSSGVEIRPGVKDPARIELLAAALRGGGEP